MAVAGILGAPLTGLLPTLVVGAPSQLALNAPTMRALQQLPMDQHDLPTVISRQDVARYQRIFSLQENGEWSKADAEIEALSSDVLMGHVQFQRYMHPTAYRSRYKELRSWLAAYSDHPDADRIYALALRRKPAKAPGVKAPTGPRTSYGYADTPTEFTYRSPRKRSNATKREIWQISVQIKRNIRNDRLTASEKLLAQKRVRNLLDQVEIDSLTAQVAAGWFIYGNDEKAYALAHAAAERSRRHMSSADWFAGLAAWRLGRIDDARKHFLALAKSEVAGDWTRAAGAFWAARTYLAGGKPELVNPMLQRAADFPRTFYGLIAARQLGREVNLQWSPPPLTRDGVAALMEMDGVRRAIALVQVGRRSMAERELRAVYLMSSAEHGEALLALSYHLGLPAIQLRLARGIVGANQQPYDQALFPVPPWRPEDGFAVDQALIFAFIRQESGFNAKAKSHVGARGLMQLMPRTASYVAGDRSLRYRERNRLFDPEFNVELGQKYINHLLKSDVVNGDLFKLAVAYNAGPGNLRKWLKRISHKNDPLLFIESIPSRETRIFVERVLSNFWIYRERLGQDTPSLDAVATGHWPVYLSLDKAGFRIADNARN